MAAVTVSAPGKAILMGEHAAVYGRPALVAAADRRLEARLTEVGGTSAGTSAAAVRLERLTEVGGTSAVRTSAVRLELPEVEVSETVGWSEIRAYARAARERWAEYERRPGPEAFGRLRGDDPAHLVKVALGEAADFLADAVPPGVELSLRSEIPIGGGFGSSAAVGAAVAAAYLRLRGAEVGAGELERLSLEIERRQHGTPSGVDSATVIRGGLVWATRTTENRVVAEPVAVRSQHLDHVRIFNSGTPAESTGAVVAAMRARRDADPERFEHLLKRMEAATRMLRRRLESADETPAPHDLITPMRDFEACLEELGVVPPRIRKIVREVERRGGAAKISGAGALSGVGAGSLLVYHPDPAAVDAWTFLDGLERLDVQLGAEGVRVEVVS